jgi:hypothetical protein
MITGCGNGIVCWLENIQRRLAPQVSITSSTGQLTVVLTFWFKFSTHYFYCKLLVLYCSDIEIINTFPALYSCLLREYLKKCGGKARGKETTRKTKT